LGASSITSNGSVKNLGIIFYKYINTYEHQYAELPTTILRTSTF